MISTIKLKKYIANTYIFGIIVNKFCYRKKLCLVILFKVDKSLEIDFYYSILFFDLAIYFKIKDG